MGTGAGRDRGSDLPLSGRSVVVTRSAEQASGLAGPLEALGAEVLVLPVIEIAEPEDWAEADAAIEHISTYDWVVLTSVNGVDRFDARMRLHGLRLSDLHDARIAVVGSATAARLHDLGVEAAVVPADFRAEGLIDAMKAAGLSSGTRVLVARASEARELLPQELRALGAVVDVAPVYRLVTALPPVDVLRRLADGGVDAIVFASGGTARRFVEVLAAAGRDAHRVLAGVAVASIGPVTTQALSGMGIPVAVEAQTSTSASLADALAGYFAGGPR